MAITPTSYKPADNRLIAGYYSNSRLYKAGLWPAISHLIVLLSDGYKTATIFDYRMAIKIFSIMAYSRLITILGSKVAISRLITILGSKVAISPLEDSESF